MASFLATMRHYWSKGNRPYQFLLHSKDDSRAFSLRDAIQEALETECCEDGDEVRVIIEKTGKHTSGRWEQTAPHIYTKIEDKYGLG